jgi:hypothetical protein
MLKGNCNQCGLCCFVGRYKCENLEVTSIIGAPSATRCKVYEKRYNDMPILLKSPEGHIRTGFCLKDTPGEEQSIIPLIRSGQCSMEEELWQIGPTPQRLES